MENYSTPAERIRNAPRLTIQLDSASIAENIESLQSEQLMPWLESLAKRQGAYEGFMTSADLDIPDVEYNDPRLADIEGYSPYGMADRERERFHLNDILTRASRLSSDIEPLYQENRLTLDILVYLMRQPNNAASHDAIIRAFEISQNEFLQARRTLSKYRYIEINSDGLDTLSQRGLIPATVLTRLQYPVRIQEPEPEPEPAASDSDYPDFDNMSPEEMMKWMESLARRQGASEGLSSSAETDSDTTESAGEYIPYGWSEEDWKAQQKREQQEKEKQRKQSNNARILSYLAENPERLIDTTELQRELDLPPFAVRTARNELQQQDLITVDAGFRAQIRATSMTLETVGVLRFLAEQDTMPVESSALQRQLDLAPYTVRTARDHLAERGFVEVDNSYQMTITDKGRVFHEALVPEYVNMIVINPPERREKREPRQLSIDLQKLENVGGAFEIIRYLYQQNEPRSDEDFMRDLDLSQRRFLKAIRRLVTKGYIEMDADRRYQLNRKGIAAGQELEAYDAADDSEEEMPEWLRGDTDIDVDDIPDWLRETIDDVAEPESSTESQQEREDATNLEDPAQWLDGLASGGSAEDDDASQSSDFDTSAADVRAQMDAGQLGDNPDDVNKFFEAAFAKAAQRDDVPDYIDDDDDTDEDLNTVAEIPDWLQESMRSDPSESVTETPRSDTAEMMIADLGLDGGSEVEIPEWLREPIEPEEDVLPEWLAEESDANEVEIPEWLREPTETVEDDEFDVDSLFGGEFEGSDDDFFSLDALKGLDLYKDRNLDRLSGEELGIIDDVEIPDWLQGDVELDSAEAEISAADAVPTAPTVPDGYKRVYATIYSTEYLLTHKVFDVRLVLSDTLYEPNASTTLISVPENTTDLTVILNASNLNIVGETRHTFAQIPIREVLASKIYSTTEGIATLSALFYADGEIIDDVSLSIKSHINPYDQREIPQLPDSTPPADRVSDQADVTIRIYTLPVYKKPHLWRFCAVAYSELSYLNAELNAETRTLGYRDVARGFITSLQQEFADTIVSGLKPNHLKQLGRRLWREVLPSGLDKLYQLSQNLKIDSILLITDTTPWLPYELAVPRQSHLCEEFSLSRWVEGLGQSRRGLFPMGPVQATEDADIAATLPKYRPLNWGGAYEGMMPARSGIELEDESVQGYHVVRASGKLAGHATQLSTVLRGQNFNEYLREKTALIQTKSPLMTLATQSTSVQQTPVSEDNYLSAIKAGACAVIGTWWSTTLINDRIFFKTFYSELSDNATVAQAMKKARKAVKLVSRNGINHLAYFAISDPMTVGYELPEGNGYLEVTSVGFQDVEELQQGQSYTFHITLRREPPAHYAGVRARVRPWQDVPAHLEILTNNVATVSDPILLSAASDSVVWQINLTPRKTGAVKLQIQVKNEDGSLFADSHYMNYTIGEQIVIARTDEQQNRQVYVDVSEPHTYIVNNEKFAYKKAISKRKIKRILEDIVDELQEPDELMPYIKKVNYILSDVMENQWWEKLVTDTYLTLVDSFYMLPWEFAVIGSSHWGLDFNLAHLPPKYSSPQNKSYNFNKVSLLLDQSLSDVYESMLLERVNHVQYINAVDELPSTRQYQSLPDVLLNDVKIRTGTKFIHICGRVENDTFSSKLNDIYEFKIHRNKRRETDKVHLKGQPIVLLSAVSSNQDVADLTPYAYQLLEMGCGAVICPISNLPLETQTQFIENFYQTAFRDNLNVHLGKAVKGARFRAFRFNKNFASLGYALFGDPLIEIAYKS